VQVDAVVTDARGRAVTDLTVDDFELYQDGQPQKITGFEFVAVRDSSARPNGKRVGCGRTASCEETPHTGRD
jgi:hypothetical protein